MKTLAKHFGPAIEP